MTASTTSRSLVIAPQWIGDAVMTEPLLRRLADRGERLVVAALPWVAPVYRAMPQVAEVMELPFAHRRLDLGPRWRLGRKMAGRFDNAYVLPNSIKSALLPWFAGIPRRVGYAGEGRWPLVNRRLPNPPGRPPMVAFYEALADVGPRAASAATATNFMPGEVAVAASGQRSTIADIHQTAAARVEARADAHAPSTRPRLTLPAGTLESATRSADVRPGRFWVFAPGAEYGPAKRWPLEHYAALARSLHAEHGLPLLLLGSGKEATLCEEIAAQAPGACRVLAGQTSLIDAFALIAASRGMISNDSGLMHVAAAFDVPQVAVYGSTSPLHTPPLNPRARVLWLKQELKLDCMPCFDRTCRFGHTLCLTSVQPAMVESALADSLRSTYDVSLPT
jgi:heptosyltransferase-2